MKLKQCEECDRWVNELIDDLCPDCYEYLQEITYEYSHQEADAWDGGFCDNH